MRPPTPSAPTIELKPLKIQVEKVRLDQEGYEADNYMPGEPRLYEVLVAITMANTFGTSDIDEVPIRFEVKVAAPNMDGMNEAVRLALRQ